MPAKSLFKLTNILSRLSYSKGLGRVNLQVISNHATGEGQLLERIGESKSDLFGFTTREFCVLSIVFGQAAGGNAGRLLG